jgi:hypothetical protein
MLAGGGARGWRRPSAGRWRRRASAVLATSDGVARCWRGRDTAMRAVRRGGDDGAARRLGSLPTSQRGPRAQNA